MNYRRVDDNMNDILVIDNRKETDREVIKGNIMKIEKSESNTYIFIYLDTGYYLLLTSGAFRRLIDRFKEEIAKRIAESV